MVWRAELIHTSLLYSTKLCMHSNRDYPALSCLVLRSPKHLMSRYLVLVQLAIDGSFKRLTSVVCSEIGRTHPFRKYDINIVVGSVELKTAPLNHILMRLYAFNWLISRCLFLHKVFVYRLTLSRLRIINSPALKRALLPGKDPY